MNELYTKIDDAIEHDDWENARHLLKQALRDEPDDHWLLTRLSTTYYEEHNYKEALATSQRALQSEPDCPLVRWDYACALDMLNRTKDAISVWKSLLNQGTTTLDADPCGEGHEWSSSLLNDCKYRLALAYADLKDFPLATQYLCNFIAARREGESSIYELVDAKHKLKEWSAGEKGSKKHVCNLVLSSDFRTKVNGFFGDSGVHLAEHCHPSIEDQLEDYLKMYPLDGYVLDPKWWFPHTTGRNKRPNWDLICHIVVNGKPGLLLVEAKAHKGEKIARPQSDKKSEPSATPKSLANDRKIRANINEANRLLNGLRVGTFSLTVNHHYQLCNRLTYLAKLAGDGIPVVLVYLGFIRSPDWLDGFASDNYWEAAMRQYMDGVVPATFPEKVFPLASGGSMRMLIRSLQAR